MLWTAFILGLAGGLHCIGMCGPLAMMIGQNDRSYTSSIVYHIGRISTYALFGALAGFFGFSLQLAGLQQWLALATGVILIGYFVLKTYSNAIQKQSLFHSRIQQRYNSFLKQNNLASRYFLGMLNGAFPCGLVYTAALASIFMGSVGGSSLFMALFGLGTLPLLLSFHFSPKFLSGKIRQKINLNIHWLSLALGVLMVIRGLGLGIPYISPIMDEESDTVSCER